ncbi:hypothetical protein IscW_ISCW016422 [Ixodes scapularis]|uniref:Uncharacterized protein n=1 Tax=Ixodes scapularis TaxID=6945 RepID=B7P2R0_IXOSC|nr:hypothetical protein IscW_ISCW016422 [Ixodes scapularis]|eukprot:XP_002402897.1 hypothetical protein IscW_ISCW016422 [Ixodes scapularis]
MAQAPPLGVVPAMVAGGPPQQQNPLLVYDPVTAAAVATAIHQLPRSAAAVVAVSNLQPRVPSPAALLPEVSIFLTDPMQIPLPPFLSPDTGEVTPQNPDPLSSPPPFEEEASAAAQGEFPGESSAEARGAPSERAPLEYERIPRVAPSLVQEQTQQAIYPPAQHMPPTSIPYAGYAVTDNKMDN